MAFTTLLKNWCSGLVLAGLAACAYEDADDDSLAFRSTIGCQGCGIGGSNTAHVNLYPIDQLHMHGNPNEDGVALLGVESPLGVLYKLRTEGDELYAYDPVTNTKVSGGQHMIGWTIKLYHAGDGKPLDVEILGYDERMPLEYDEKGGTVSGYALGFKPWETPSELESVCPDKTGFPDVIAATIVRGELYDDKTGEVVPNNEWITIACFGNAVAKTKLFGYGPQEKRPGTAIPATPEQREATIRMLTADYCGSAMSYTVDGTPLEWRNDNGAIAPAATPGFADIEALWTADGAICLSHPRLADIKEVREECQLPACTHAMVMAGGYDWTTWRVP